MFKLQAVCTLKATCSIGLVLTFIKLTRAKCMQMSEWITAVFYQRQFQLVSFSVTLSQLIPYLLTYLYQSYSIKSVFLFSLQNLIKYNQISHLQLCFVESMLIFFNILFANCTLQYFPRFECLIIFDLFISVLTSSKRLIELKVIRLK